MVSELKLVLLHLSLLLVLILVLMEDGLREEAYSRVPVAKLVS